MRWICKEEYFIGVVISGGYVGDIIQISRTHILSKYHPHIIQISFIYHPHISKYHPHIIQISSISPKYRPNIPRSIFFTTPQLNEKIWHGYFKKKLHFEIRLKLHFSSSRYYSNIIQISSRNHPNPNHPESSRYHSVDIDFYNPPTWWKVEF